MIGICRHCTHAFETTTEEAYSPDCVCAACHRRMLAPHDGAFGLPRPASGSPDRVMLASTEHAIIQYVLGRSRFIHPTPRADLDRAVSILESTARQLAVDPSHSRDVSELHAMLRILRGAMERETP